MMMMMIHGDGPAKKDFVNKYDTKVVYNHV